MDALWLLRCMGDGAPHDVAAIAVDMGCTRTRSASSCTGALKQASHGARSAARAASTARDRDRRDR